jgi:hypothetical protein
VVTEPEVAETAPTAATVRNFNALIIAAVEVLAGVE